MQLQQAIQTAQNLLEKKGIAEARLCVEWLACRQLNCSRTALPFYCQQHLSTEQLRNFEDQLERLEQHEPLQYVLGDTEFMGHRFLCDRRALIPRPETELLVESVLEQSGIWEDCPVIADIGTGCGCIAISLVLAKPHALCHAFDIDPMALSLASENAKIHAVAEKIIFHQEPFENLLLPNSIAALISNPPYVKTIDWFNLPVMIKNFEPRQALDGGADGLDIIRPLITAAQSVLRPNGWLLFEFGIGQSEAVRELLQLAGMKNIKIVPDYAGIPRIAISCK